MGEGARTLSLADRGRAVRPCGDARGHRSRRRGGRLSGAGRAAQAQGRSSLRYRQRTLDPRCASRSDRRSASARRSARPHSRRGRARAIHRAGAGRRPGGCRRRPHRLQTSKPPCTLMTQQSIDLFVIGGGSGGVRAARIAAGHGARVMIAEEYRVGGTCVIRGCVPKKLLVYAARFADEFEDAAGFGWTLDEPVFDWARLIANKDREIARLEAAYVTTLERAGVTLVRSRAVIEDAHTVRLPASGEKVRAGTILISTGAAPHL